MKRRTNRAVEHRGPWRGSFRKRSTARRHPGRRGRQAALRVERLEGRAMLANAAPSGTDTTISLPEDGSYTFTEVDFGFIDLDNHQFSAVKISSLPTNGFITLNGAAVTAGQFVSKADIIGNQLAFTPAPNANGPDYASFTFQVQDDSIADNLDLTPNTIRLNVTPVNDAPVASGSAMLAAVDEDTVSPTGSAVSALFGGTFSDTADTVSGGSTANTLLGVVLTANAATAPQGKWQWNNSGTWTDIDTSLSDAAGLYLTAATEVRFLPAANFNGTPGALTARLVDSSASGLTNGNSANVSANGATTAYSAATVSLTTSITAVNDAPVGTDNTVTILEDATYTFSVSDFFRDPNDSPSNTLFSVTIVSVPLAGSLTLSNVSVNPDQAIPVAALGNLKYKPAPNVSGSSYAWFTFRVKDNGGTARGGIDTDPTVRTITIDVTPVNDAPTRTAGSLTAITVDQDSKNATAVALGLAGLDYSPGGGDDEVLQELTYTVTQVPAFITLFKAGGTTAVAASAVVTLEELRGLTYKTVPSASGSDTVKWSVVDTDSNSAPSSNILFESLAITVQADTTPPSPPQRPSLDINTDSGEKGDNNTTFVRPTLTVVGPSDAASLSISLTNSTATPSSITLNATRDAGTDTWRATPALNLAVGVWSVTARAKDAALNESASSTALSLKIESVPATPSTPDLDAQSDSGASDTDDVTNKTRPTFKGIAVAGLTVEVWATKSGGTAVSLGTTAAGTDGAWELAPVASKALLDGIYDITATAKDTSGNTSVASAPLAVTIDTTPPDAPTVPVLLALDDSGKAGDGLTNVTKPRFTGTAAANIPVVLVATSPLGETSPKGTAIADADGKWKIDSEALTDGLWTIQARATDAAGNQSKLSAETKLTINTAVPGAPTVSLASLDDTGYSNIDGITKVTTPTFLGVAPAGTTVVVYRKNLTLAGPAEAIGTVVADKTTGAWLLPFDAKALVPFIDGVYSISATAIDVNGTASPEGTLADGLMVDTTPPSLQSLEQVKVDANKAVPSVAVAFDEEVIGLLASDFELAVTANGIRRLLSLEGTATVAPDAPGAKHDKDWTVGNLSTITGVTGAYAIGLRKARLDAGKTTASDLAGNLLPYSSATATWTTDTSAPTVRSMTATPTAVPTNVASPWNTSVAKVAIAFDEAVTGVDTGDFVLTRDGTTIPLPVASSVSGSGRDWQLNGLADATKTDGNYTLTLVAKDSGIKDTAGSGNLLFANASASWRIDTTRPTGSFSPVASPRATAIDSITLTFAEPVRGVELTDFTLKHGSTVKVFSVSTLLAPTSGTGTTFVLTGLAALTAESGTYTLEFNKDTGTKVVDAAGNQMASNPTPSTWTVDTKAPTATIAITPIGALRNAAVTSASVTFDMNVSGVSVDDFRLTRNGSVVSLAGATVTSTSDAAYTLTIPNAAASVDGTYVLAIVASGTGIAGKAAPFNPLQKGDSIDWTMDGTKPTVALDVIGKTGTVFTVRALFSEPVSGFSATDTNDRTIAGGTIGNARNGTLVGREYLFDVTPTVPAAGNPIGPVVVTVKADAAKDKAGNNSIASSELRLVSDFTPPSVSIAAPQITKDSPFTVTATFSEPVTGITVADLDVMTANAKVDSVTEAGATYTFKVQPTADGEIQLRLPAKAAVDGSANASLASNTVSVTYASQGPAVTLASLSGARSRALVLSVTATFTEAVTGITASDLTVTGASVVGVTGSAKNYTFRVRPAADGIVTLKLPENVAADAIGWGNKASDELKIVSDRTSPTVVSMTDPTAAGKVTITLSEEVTGFDRGDFVLARNGTRVSLAGATLSGPSGATKNEWTLDLGASIASSGSYRLELAASTSGIADLAGNRLIDDRASKTTALVRSFALDKASPIAAFTSVPEFVIAPVASLGLGFRDSVTNATEQVSGLDLADLVLLRDGTRLDSLDKLGGVALTLAAGPESNYSISGLANHTSSDGRYTITLNTAVSGIKDDANNPLAQDWGKDAAVSWTLDSKRPTATVGPVATVSTSPLSALPVTFSEFVTGADSSDFTLTRNGVVVPLAGAVLVAKGAGSTTFELTNLSSLTSALGDYSLTLRAAGTGIVDVAKNQLAEPVVAKWSRVAPPAPGSLTGTFAAVWPNPRTSSLPSLAINFTRSVTGVDSGDFFLSRTVNGITSALPTTGLTVTGTAASRTVEGLENLTKDSGQYELRLKAAGSGIVDAGNKAITLQSDIVASWSTIASASVATIVLDAPVAAGAAYDAATITFTKPVTGVKLTALSLFRGGVPVSLTGTSLVALSQTSYKISGLAPIVAGANSYELRLVAAGSGIIDLNKVPVQENATVSWTQAATTVRAAFLAVAPVTPAPIAAVRLRFNAAVRGVDVNDFELTVDRADGMGQQVVPLRGVIISGSGVSWTVSNLAVLQDGAGTYTLRLKKSNGDIRTGAGAALAEDAIIRWRIGSLAQNGPGGGVDDR